MKKKSRPAALSKTPALKAKSKWVKSAKPKPPATFPIVGIGASAGGLDALEKMFSHLPKIGMAYVVITHLDRDHISILPSLLKKHANMPVILIKSGALIKANHIYVIPPRKNVFIKDGVLQLVEQNEPHYTNFPINIFFRSLAEDQGENAIGVILSGSGGDGTQGISYISKHGGLTFAQDPKTAAFNSMPNNAINTGLIDYILPPEAIPLQLNKIVHDGKEKEGIISPELQQIFILLRTQTGHDFSHYKLNTIRRRIEKQMRLNNSKSLKDYVRFLQINPNKINNLFKDLLIGVTRFFRDPHAFSALKNKAFPLIFKRKPQDYCIRIWIPACSTGEEAYSIAVLLREYMEKIKKHFNVQIFATDIDVNALEIARKSIYPATIANDVSPERLKRFFIKEDEHYKIKKEIRSMVIFGEQNIIKDPPFTKLDLVCCRNLLIYLDIPLQRKLLPLFHYSLKPNGILFLGTSEVTSSFTGHFQFIDKKWRIFTRKEGVSTDYSLLNMTSLSPSFDSSLLPCLEKNIIYEKGHGLENHIQELQKYLLEHHFSPCVVINKKGDILYINGEIKPFISTFNEKNDANIYDYAYPDLKMILLPAMRRLENGKHELTYENLKIHHGKKSTAFNLRMTPITVNKSLRNLILIIFEYIKKPNIEKLINKSSPNKHNQKLDEVIQELQYTRENLQATIEELEAGNEELQSTNEELQSTNEEIETSKEELHSLNEELIIVNSELQGKIDELATANDDMNNLFNSTQVAAFFLDNSLRIKRFTPQTKEFAHLISTDIGRPISDFSTTIQNQNLAKLSEEVLKTLMQKNIEVQTANQKWYHLQIIPYRTLTNMIDGVIITITDITQFKCFEQELKKLNQELHAALTYSEDIINTVREPLLVLDQHLKIISANRAFYEKFKTHEAGTLGKHIYQLDDNNWNKPGLLKLLNTVISHDHSFENFQLDYDSPTGHQTYLLNGRKIYHQKNKSDMILLAIEYKTHDGT